MLKHKANNIKNNFKSKINNLKEQKLGVNHKQFKANNLIKNNKQKETTQFNKAQDVYLVYLTNDDVKDGRDIFYEAETRIIGVFDNLNLAQQCANEEFYKETWENLLCEMYSWQKDAHLQVKVKKMSLQEFSWNNFFKEITNNFYAAYFVYQVKGEFSNKIKNKVFDSKTEIFIKKILNKLDKLNNNDVIELIYDLKAQTYSLKILFDVKKDKFNYQNFIKKYHIYIDDNKTELFSSKIIDSDEMANLQIHCGIVDKRNNQVKHTFFKTYKNYCKEIQDYVK